ncbi:MAG TPA: tetratricopeptide repeat protein [Bryobacteraceae bacterium]|nr:tetratricopeptide repeat protein [Bryobacteraceae bacterium]
MGFHSSGLAAILLASGVLANGQPPTRTSERAVFFSGEVALADGSPLPQPVLIQRICKGSNQGETWTDAKGDFSFKISVGGSDPSDAGAQAATPNTDLSRPIGNSTYYSNPVTTALRDCEVQAVLTGYWSDRVNIALKNTLDDTRIGRIILHPVTKEQALTVSATSLAAPSSAKKSYDKAMSAIREQHWEAAVTDLKKAVAAYPQFAEAWFQLGLASQSRNDLQGAGAAWKEAVKCDPKFVKPYEGLVSLAERQQNWQDEAKYSHDWIQLDPEDFPAAYLYNAVANARMNNVDQAEASARQAYRLDKDGRIPRISYVLGLLLMQKKDYTEAATCLRRYLELAPNAKDADAVRQELSRLEGR